MHTLLRLSILCALLASVVWSVGAVSPTAAQNAAYTDTMNSEADGLLSTESPDPAKVTFAYQDGTFVMQAPDQAPPREILTDIKTPSMQGTQVLFDVSIGGDVNLKYVVVGCRAGPGHSGYQLAVDLDTAEATLRSRDGEFSQVLDRTEEPFPLNTGATMNQIGIECEDNQISAIVNGLTVLTAFDSLYTDGHAYIGVGSRVGASDGLTATFDNLTVADLGSSGFENGNGEGHSLDTPAEPQLTSDVLANPRVAMAESLLMTIDNAPDASAVGGELDLHSGEGARLALGVQLQDFFAEMAFETPQSAPGGLWLYGFCFWTDPTGGCTDLFIQSDGMIAKWGLGTFPATGAYTLIDSGDMPAGSVDLTPGAENVMMVLVYGGSAILSANGQIAAVLDLSGQPIAGEVAGRFEFSGDDPTGTQPLTMSVNDLMVWDMSKYPLSFTADTSADAGIAPDAQSVAPQRCRLTQPSGGAGTGCGQ